METGRAVAVETMSAVVRSLRPTKIFHDLELPMMKTQQWSCVCLRWLLRLRSEVGCGTWSYAGDGPRGQVTAPVIASSQQTNKSIDHVD